jgi:hypothetical protein
VDPFIPFTLILIDASGTPPKASPPVQKHERMDLVARQFRDFLNEGDPSDISPHRFPLSPDFKLARQVAGPAAFLSFQVDEGDGVTEKLREVVQMLLVREGSPAAALVEKLASSVRLPELTGAPTAVVIQVAPSVPFVIRDWYSKPAAGFFGEAR